MVSVYQADQKTLEHWTSYAVMVTSIKLKYLLLNNPYDNWGTVEMLFVSISGNDSSNYDHNIYVE